MMPKSPVGFRARRHAGLVDVDRKAALNVLDDRGTDLERGSLILDPDQFYILASKELCVCRLTLLKWCRSIRWSVNFAYIMPGSSIPVSAMLRDRAQGSRAVLEVRSHEVPFIWKMARSSGGWFMNRSPRSQIASMAR